MFPQNNNIRPVQTFPLPQIPLRNPQQISTTSIQRLPDQNITSALASNPLPTGFLCLSIILLFILNLYLEIKQIIK
jgi:hypothetical protein